MLSPIALHGFLPKFGAVKMNVEIWSDVVCPWCYIGKRRFETALAKFAHREDVSVVWRSFELDPQAPRQFDGTLDDLLARKYRLPRAEAAAMNANVTSLAAAEGLTYHLEQARPSNTFDAHRLIHLAAHHGLQGEAKERLLRAYFTDGLAIGDADVLAELAAEIGLDKGEARDVLAGNAYADEVRADEGRAAAFGVRGVPFVVIDERVGVSGAQSSEVFLQALEQAWAASASPVAMTGQENAGACDGDSCEVPA
ncbi:MAG: oxidoreductase [Chloroflexi bacterium]|nr:oxidoreductase [Chloroflexota bacterium]